VRLQRQREVTVHPASPSRGDGVQDDADEKDNVADLHHRGGPDIYVPIWSTKLLNSSSPSGPARAMSPKVHSKAPAPAPEPEPEPEPKVVHDVATYTCKELVDEAVRISTEQAQGASEVHGIAIYKIKTVKDDQQAYRLGKKEIGKNDLQVTVLKCSGVGSLSKSYSQKVDFSVAYDENEQAFVAINPKGDAY
jgi:hypothetical protein